jgi:hypothetical protein
MKQFVLKWSSSMSAWIATRLDQYQGLYVSVCFWEEFFFLNKFSRLRKISRRQKFSCLRNGGARLSSCLGANFRPRRQI